MFSKIVPFSNIVDAVKDETGIQNLRNLYPRLRRLVYRIERDLGFGYGLLLKKITYKKSDGTLYDKKIRLPEDLIFIEHIGMCKSGLCPNSYNHQGNYLFLCEDRDSIDLIYYAMLCDGEGNPIITENHFDAVVAGIKHYLYQPKMWNKQGSAQYGKMLQDYYFDRIGEAIGSDLMPTTDAEWSQIASILQMSRSEAIMYSESKNNYCCIEPSENNEVIDPAVFKNDSKVYYWQFDSLTKDISLAPTIDQPFLDLKQNSNIQLFLDGHIVSYYGVGRICFTIDKIDEDDYRIVDAFGNDITNVVFDKYYISLARTQIFVSKEYYTTSNIYYKFIKN